MQLPIMGSPEETLEVVKFLNTKVNGSTIEDAKTVIDKKLLDARKISAYVIWGFVARDADKIKLTERGRELIKCTTQEEQCKIYQDVVQEIEAYRSVIERLYYNKSQSVITNVEVASLWYEAKKFEMTSDNENTLKDRAVCFFKICEIAGFGKFYLGRRGQQTRLEFNRDAITIFIERADDIGEGDIQIEEKGDDKNHISKTIDESVGETLGDELVPLIISFIDGRKAILQMPADADKGDAQYVFDMIKLMLPRQYGLDEV